MVNPITTRHARIHTLLQEHFFPKYIDLNNESHQHRVPTGSETHFKLTLVSVQFEGLNRVARHRLVNTLLIPEIQSGLHALSLSLYTPDEWANRPEPMQTPPCQHKKSDESFPQ